MKDWIKWITLIGAIITICKAIKATLTDFDSSKLKPFLSKCYNKFKAFVNHPLYGKVAISVNALFLLTCCIYACLLFDSLNNKGINPILSLALLSVFLIASINFFYQNIKLHQ